MAVSSGGPTMRKPAVSPSHHTSHAGATSTAGNPPIARQSVPLEAVSVIPKRPASRNVYRSRRPAAPGLKSRRRRTVTASTGPRALPAATPIAAHHGKMASSHTSAPANTPGQNRRPARNNTATAIPVGGQRSAM